MYTKNIIKGISLAAVHSCAQLLMNGVLWKTDSEVIFYGILYFLIPLIYIAPIAICFYDGTYRNQAVSCLTYAAAWVIFGEVLRVTGAYAALFHLLFPGEEMWVGEGLVFVIFGISAIVSSIIGIGLLFIITALRKRGTKKS